MRISLRVIVPVVLISLVLSLSPDMLYGQRSRGSGGSQPLRGGGAQFREKSLPLEFDNRPFNISTGQLPRFYAGYEPQLLYRIIGNEGAGASPHTYAIRLNPTDVRYDAGKGALKAYCAFSPVWSGGKTDGVGKALPVKYLPIMDNRYTATDAHGAKMEIEEIRFREYAVAVANFLAFPTETPPPGEAAPTAGKTSSDDEADLLRNSHRQAIAGEIPLAPSEAKEREKQISALLVFSPVEPYVTSDTVTERVGAGKARDYEALYFYLHGRLVELWFYEFDTGKVLAKIKPRKALRLP